MSAEHTAGFGKKTLSARDLSAGDPISSDGGGRVPVLLQLPDLSQPAARSGKTAAAPSDSAAKSRVAVSAEPAKQAARDKQAIAEVVPAEIVERPPAKTAAAPAPTNADGTDEVGAPGQRRERRERRGERGTGRGSRSERKRETAATAEPSHGGKTDTDGPATPRGIRYENQTGGWKRWAKAALAIAGLFVLFAVIYATISGRSGSTPEMTAMPSDFNSESAQSGGSGRPRGFEIFPELPPVEEPPPHFAANKVPAHTEAEPTAADAPADNTGDFNSTGSDVPAEPPPAGDPADAMASADANAGATRPQYPVTDPATFEYSPTYHLALQSQAAVSPTAPANTMPDPAAAPNYNPSPGYEPAPADEFPPLTQPDVTSPVSVPSRNSAWQEEDTGGGQSPNTARLQPRIEAPPLR